MPAAWDPDKPAPVTLRVGQQTLATAYARRAPTTSRPSWEWRMSTLHPAAGTRVMRSRGRLPQAEVEAALVSTRSDHVLVQQTTLNESTPSKGWHGPNGR